MKKFIAILLALCLALTMIQIPVMAVWADDQETGQVQLFGASEDDEDFDDEDEDEDDDIISRQVKYDLVTMGSYPQVEIVADQAQSGAYGKNWYHLENGQIAEDMSKYYEVDATLYDELTALEDEAWSDGVATLDGVKYCRVKGDDAVYVSYGTNYYRWDDMGTYHYFKYMPIKWRVLRTSKTYNVLMADQVLDFVKADDVDADAKATTWRNTTLYKWLNGEFMTKAFTAEEQNAIVAASGSTKVNLMSVDNFDNCDYGFNFLSGASDVARQLKATTYAKALGAFTKERGQRGENSLGASNWYLAPSSAATEGGFVVPQADYAGLTGSSDKTSNGACGVVPVIYVDNTYTGLGDAGQTDVLSTIKLEFSDFVLAASVDGNSKANVLNPAIPGHSGPLKPEVTCTWINSSNYTVTYENNDKVSTKGSPAKAIIQGVGDWEGTIEKNFKIVDHLDIPAERISIAAKAELPDEAGVPADQKKGACPKVTITGLEEGVDFTVTYTNNKEIGSTGYALINGIDCYLGSNAQKSFEVIKCNHNWVQGAVPVAHCFGPQPVAYKCSKCGDTKIVEDEVPAAEHTPFDSVAKATFNYAGDNITFCLICKASLKVNEIIGIPKVKVSKSSFVYNRKKQVPTVTLTSEIKANDAKEKFTYKLVEGKDYKLTKPSKSTNVGKYSIKITLMGDRFDKGIKLKTGKYAGEKTVSYSINPVATKVTSVKALKKGFKVKWAKKTSKMKASRITGYEVQYATSSKFKSAKKVKVKGYSKYYKEVKKLKAKKKYYVRVRTYMTVSGKTCYSEWSKAKAVTTKK